MTDVKHYLPLGGLGQVVLVVVVEVVVVVVLRRLCAVLSVGVGAVGLTVGHTDVGVFEDDPHIAGPLVQSLAGHEQKGHIQPSG